MAARATTRRSFVEAARREKRAALEAAGRAGVRLPVRAEPHRGRGAGRLRRRHGRAGPGGRGRRPDRGPPLAGQDDVPAPGGRLRPDPGLLRAGRARRRVRAARAARPGRPSSGVDAGVLCSGPASRARVTVRATGGSRCWPSRCGRCPAARPRPGPTAPVTFGGLQDPEVRYRQRYADLAVHPDVRAVFRLRARAVTLDPPATSTSSGFSRWRRRCCSRSTAARRRGRS